MTGSSIVAGHVTLRAELETLRQRMNSQRASLASARAPVREQRIRQQRQRMFMGCGAAPKIRRTVWLATARCRLARAVAVVAAQVGQSPPPR
jgi:hypothetical protein